jgi:putative membrane protein
MQDTSSLEIAVPRRPLRYAAYVALVIGISVAIALVAWRGFDTIAGAMGALGSGILLLPCIYAPHIFGAAFSWSLQFPDDRRPPYRIVLRAIWTGIAVETLMPLGGLMAEVVKARLLIRSGTRGADAASIAVVDMTVQSFVLAFWAIIGVVATTVADTGANLGWPALAGAIVLGIAIGTLLLLQRAGLFGRLARIGARIFRTERWERIVVSAAHLDQTIHAIYRRPWRVVIACAIRSATRGLMAVEIWAASRMMDHPISALDACSLVGIIGALRAAAFVLPGGWGLQEAGYMVLGKAIGVTPDIALSLSLATRARELMIGIPALTLWQISESRVLRAMVGQQQRVG